MICCIWWICWLGLQDSKFVTRWLCYKLEVCSLKDAVRQWWSNKSCIMGNVGSSVFLELAPYWGTKSEEISAFCCLILTVLVLTCFSRDFTEVQYIKSLTPPLTSDANQSQIGEEMWSSVAGESSSNNIYSIILYISQLHRRNTDHN